MVAVARVLLQHPPTREIVAGLDNNAMEICQILVLQADLGHIV